MYLTLNISFKQTIFLLHFLVVLSN